MMLGSQINTCQTISDVVLQKFFPYELFSIKQVLKEAGNSELYSCNQVGRHLSQMLN